MAQTNHQTRVPDGRQLAPRLSRGQQWALIIGGALILAGVIHPIASFVEWRSQAYGWFKPKPSPPQSAEEQREIAVDSLMRHLTAAYHYDGLFWRIVWAISGVSIACGLTVCAAVLLPLWRNRCGDGPAAAGAVSS